MRGFARRRSVYAVRTLYVAVAAVALLDTWGAVVPGGPSAFADLGRRLFLAVFWIQLGFIPLAALMAAAQGLQREFVNRRMDLLILSPLDERSLVRGIWRAASAQAAVLSLAGAPVLAFCVFLGGAGWEDLAAALGVTLATAALAAALAVRAAALRNSVAGAAALAVVHLAATVLVPFVISVFSAGASIAAAVFLHPLFAAAALRLEIGLFPTSAAWAVSLVATAFWVRLVLGSATGHLQRRLRTPDPPEGRPFGGPALLQTGVWDSHPLLWLELRSRAVDRLRPRTRLLGLVAFYAVVYVVFTVTQGRVRGGFDLLGGLYLGAAVLMGAFLFRPGDDGALLGAPVSTSEVLRAKLLASLASPEALALQPPLLAGLFLYSFRSGLEGVFLFSTSSLLLFALAFLLSAFASVLARSYRGAVVGAASAVLLLVAGLSAAWPAALPFRIFDALIPPPGEFALEPDALPRAREAFRTSAPLLASGVVLAYLLLRWRFAVRRESRWDTMSRA